MNTATLPPPGPGQPTAAEARIADHDKPPICSSMPPGWAGLAGRVAEAVEQALAAAPGEAARSRLTPMSIGAPAGPDLELIIAPTWWLDWRARVEHAELDHRADAAIAAIAAIAANAAIGAIAANAAIAATAAATAVAATAAAAAAALACTQA